MATQDHPHWSQMNCLLNPMIKNSENSFYISEKEPPNFILPPDLQSTIYHPCCIDGETGVYPDEVTINRIIQFIRTNDQTGSGNITELSRESLNRLFSTPCIMGLLMKESTIVGTMISLIFRVRTRDGFSFLTSYTTFLCVAAEYRNHGLAMALIRVIMHEGYSRYQIHHGYYITFTPHHSVNAEIKSWYRPLNLKRSLSAGFDLQTFPGQRLSEAAMKQRMAYHVAKPNPLPVKVTNASYTQVHKLLARGDLYLAPTKQEFIRLSNCFDIYLVGDYGLFMLFPLTAIISSTGKTVRNAQLALMIGDVIPQAMWAANDENYDLLYGWYAGDVTEERVAASRGIITASTCYVELYNTRVMLPLGGMTIPLF
jgi:hypothetical protein